ncbi:MAG: hypothetical protein PF482_13355 [Desulfobacteraceae bacterium]|jgi:hypothetical protein|nr:hypothetical protein [Desulfobacteraceae bacterium]
MKKINVAGMSSLLGGLSIFGWRALGDFMGSSTKLSSKKGMSVIDKNDQLRFYDLMHEDNFDWIESLPWGFLREGADYVVTMPLWLLMVIVGGALLLIGGIFVKK